MLNMLRNEMKQAMATHQLEEALACPGKTQQQQERKIRSHPEQALKCPRCASTNTKFCYYNNYSLSQPRYFCKGCRRYWTQGGSLRNVPVGGGCRKNKRTSSSSAKKTHETNPITTNSNPMLPPTLITPSLSYDPSDLTLAFASLQGQTPATASKQLGQLDSLDSHGSTELVPTPTNGFLDILRSGFVDTTGTAGFNSLYYGFGMNGHAEVGGGNVGGEDGVFSSTEGLAGGASQDSCKDLVEGETKMLMCLPWQMAPGDGNIAVESGRDYWAGVGSYWHGLINSSLM